MLHQIGVAYWTTTNSKLALAVATLGIHFAKQKQIRRWNTTRGEQVEWYFEPRGQWKNFDGTETASIAAADCEAAWDSRPNSLPDGAHRELLLIKRALENRDEMFAVFRNPNVSVSYVAEVLEENRKFILEMYAKADPFIIERWRGRRLVIKQNATNKEKELWNKRLKA